MLGRIQQLGQGQRILIFVMLMVGGILLIAAITVFLILISINSTPRQQAVPLLDTVTVQQFAALPGEDAYPPAVAVAPDGTVYTGSYATGTLWAITADGTVREVPGSNDALASVTGLDVALDGTLYVLTRASSDPRAAGGAVWRLSPAGELSEFASVPDGFIAPDDVTVDSEGRVYASDRGRREIWRWNADGSGGTAWWQPEEGVYPTGLAYDPANNAIIVTDFQQNTIHRIPVESGRAELIYRYPEATNLPSFDGVTVAPDGTLYVAALDQNGIVTFQEGEMVYIAGNFRGASDVAIAPDGRLYVTNFDSPSLVAPGIRPQLPFALDVVTVICCNEIPTQG
jgi:sugar lactone lactonase YvrE